MGLTSIPTDGGLTFNSILSRRLRRLLGDEIGKIWLVRNDPERVIQYHDHLETNRGAEI